MMDNKLLKKLQIKTGFNVTVINAPTNLDEIIGDIPQEITFSTNLNNYNALLLFAINKADMIAALSSENNKITDQTIFWIVYPKTKTKIAGDLNLMQSWEELKNYQLTPVLLPLLMKFGLQSELSHKALPNALELAMQKLRTTSMASL
jgi:hypothetical protein